MLGAVAAPAAPPALHCADRPPDVSYPLASAIGVERHHVAAAVQRADPLAVQIYGARVAVEVLDVPLAPPDEGRLSSGGVGVEPPRRAATGLERPNVREPRRRVVWPVDDGGPLMGRQLRAQAGCVPTGDRIPWYPESGRVVPPLSQSTTMQPCALDSQEQKNDFPALEWPLTTRMREAGVNDPPVRAVGRRTPAMRTRRHRTQARSSSRRRCSLGST